MLLLLPSSVEPSALIIIGALAGVFLTLLALLVSLLVLRRLQALSAPPEALPGDTDPPVPCQDTTIGRDDRLRAPKRSP